MKQLLPDFCRRQWVGAEARSLWEPRVTAIGQHFAAAERASVGTGIRAAALQNVRPEQLPDLTQRAAKRGLIVTPLSSQGRPEGYAAGTVQQTTAGPWDYRVALTTFGAAGPFIEAWEKNDDETIGRLLGYPLCCRKFFSETWGAGSVDPTWAMADHDDGLEGCIEANILLRWLGVRYVPHMPCGFRCQGTIELGGKFRDAIPELERGWMDELLRMPMRWSSLYGIGEVVTPTVTLNFRSDNDHELREIRREGVGYPELGANGITFPYRPPPARRPDERLWTDNGFSSLEAMERAHAIVVSAAPPNGDGRSVLDLGSGNGMLARKLAGSKGRAVGVESDAGRAARSARYLDDVIVGDAVFEYVDGDFDLVVLMPGRLLERDPHSRARVTKIGSIAEARDRLHWMVKSRPLLVYCYGDWLERYGSLEELCRAAGLPGFLEGVCLGDSAAAGMWRWA